MSTLTVREDPPRAAAPARRWTRRPGVLTLARVALVVAVVGVVGASVSDNAFWVRIATSAAIAFVLTGSYNLIFGYAGLFSLAHVAVYGVGGYASVYLESQYGWSFWVAVPVTLVATTLVGLLVALPTSRLSGAFLALGTLAFGIAADELYLQWTSVTGGAQGFLGIAPPTFGDRLLLGGTMEYFWLTAVVAVVCFEIYYRISRSAVGRRFVALRESEVATQSVGIDPVRVRRLAFALSGLFAGLAGALFAHFALFISPESFSLDRMIQVLIVLLIGGAGTVAGPILGVAALVAIQEAGERLGDASPLLFGLAIVVIISFAPSGLVGLAEKGWRRATRPAMERLRTRRQPDKVTAAAVDQLASQVEDVARGERTDRAERLTVSGVTVQFAGVRALHDASLTLRAGEVLGLIGPNGAGKTSMVNVVTGAVRPAEGSVRLDDRELVGLKMHQVARLGVVRTFQTTRLVPTFDLLDNVVLGRDTFANASLPEQVLLLPRSRADDERAREVARTLLELVGVAEFAGVRAADLPYGVQRRAEIAKAMALDPAFLLLDEPGAGLSAFERDEIATAIRAVSRTGVGCLLIDHNVPFVSSVCDRLVVLAAGEVLTEGPTDEVLAHEDVVAAYLGRATL